MARRTREIWRNLIGQFERSGKTIEQFADERQIPTGTLKNWIYRLRKEKAEETAEILPVRVISSASPSAARRSEEEQDGAVVEVMLVRFASGTAGELIAEVVSRLRRC
jgi:transposase-like protein